MSGCWRCWKPTPRVADPEWAVVGGHRFKWERKPVCGRCSAAPRPCVGFTQVGNCALRFSAPLLLAPQRSSRSNGGLKWTVDGLGSGLFTNLAK
jgi:hypothetical protein